MKSRFKRGKSVEVVHKQETTKRLVQHCKSMRDLNEILQAKHVQNPVIEHLPSLYKPISFYKKSRLPRGVSTRSRLKTKIIRKLIVTKGRISHIPQKIFANRLPLLPMKSLDDYKLVSKEFFIKKSIVPSVQRHKATKNKTLDETKNKTLDETKIEGWGDDS